MENVENEETGTDRFSAAVMRRVVEHQASLGFSWQATLGRGGPLSLTAVELPASAGKALAEEILDDGVASGWLDEVLKARLPSVA